MEASGGAAPKAISTAYGAAAVKVARQKPKPPPKRPAQPPPHCAEGGLQHKAPVRHAGEASAAAAAAAAEAVSLIFGQAAARTHSPGPAPVVAGVRDQLGAPRASAAGLPAMHAMQQDQEALQVPAAPEQPQREQQQQLATPSAAAAATAFNSSQAPAADDGGSSAAGGMQAVASRPWQELPGWAQHPGELRQPAPVPRSGSGSPSRLGSLLNTFSRSPRVSPDPAGRPGSPGASPGGGGRAEEAAGAGAFGGPAQPQAQGVMPAPVPPGTAGERPAPSPLPPPLQQQQQQQQQQPATAQDGWSSGDSTEELIASYRAEEGGRSSAAWSCHQLSALCRCVSAQPAAGLQ